MRTFQTRRNGLLLTSALALILAACASDAADSTTTVATTSPAGDTTTTSVAEPTTTTVPATTTTTISEAEARAVVEAAFAAFDAGDMETWYLLREGGHDEGDGDYELAMQVQIEIEGCEYLGYGEWQVHGDFAVGHRFVCPGTQTDAFLRAAGIVLELNYDWVIGDSPETSLAGSTEDFFTAEVMMLAFRSWLRDTYPDVEASIEYDEDGADPVPASVPIALEYIDEFVAQSDFYPLTEPVPPLP